MKPEWKKEFKDKWNEEHPTVLCLEIGRKIPNLLLLCEKESAERWYLAACEKRAGETRGIEVWAIKDTFHPGINGGEISVVRSDHPNFYGDIREFFKWVLQHGGSFDDVYRIPVEWKITQTSTGEDAT